MANNNVSNFDFHEVVIKKNAELNDIGFNLLGKEGFSHIIYNVTDNYNDQIEEGDVIIKINKTDVYGLTSKEVLTRLIQSNEPTVELVLQRDPKIKSHVFKYLTPSEDNVDSSKITMSTTSNKSTVRSTVSEPLCRPSRIPTAIGAKSVTNSWSLPQSPQHKRTTNGGSQAAQLQEKQQPQQQPRFEAYMMTGDLILNISKAPRVSNIKQPKKNETSPQFSGYHNRKNGSVAPQAKYDSTSSSNSPSEEHCPGVTSKPVQKSPSDLEDAKELDRSVIMNKSRIPSNIMSPQTSIKSKSSSVTSSSSSSANNSSFSNDAVDCPLIKNSKIHVAEKEASIIISASSSVSSAEMSYSVPTSPTSLNTPNTGDVGAYDDYKSKQAFNSAPTSPETATQDFIKCNMNNLMQECNSNTRKNKQRDMVGFRTSRSEDPLQQTQHRDGMNAVVPIDIDDDFNSSLNTLLDTRNDSDASQNADRIVWTYNAPVTTTVLTKVITSPLSQTSSSMSSSPQRSELASPTSVSSSVMSSGSKNEGTSNDIQNLTCPLTNDQSVSEAVSNISSPDYQDEQFSARELGVISDPSDSDSTILASEKRYSDIIDPGNKIIIQVAGLDTLKSVENNEPELERLNELGIQGPNGNGINNNINNNNINNNREGSPTISDDGSDIDSLHSFHYSPKGVDMPSAIRLAKRLYGLEGFRKSDVSKHLSKNNEFSRAVAEEYLKYFQFEKLTLDEALRLFLKQFSLSGETQERERVLVHFSKRYLDCNPGSFNSQDAVHTLTCAIMLLNTDLHGQNIGRKMTCSEFIDNLSELNDGDNFPKDILKHLYHAIKNHAIEWATDDEMNDISQPREDKHRMQGSHQQTAEGISNSLFDTSDRAPAIEYKKGYVMRKCCYDSNNKKTPFGKRSWKMFFCTLRDLVLYLHKDEHGFRKSQVSDHFHNTIRIHHALATKASDYVKKQHVFRLQTAEQAEYLFQTSDSKELTSWIDTINFVCGAFSAPVLLGALGNSKRFQRPLLSSAHTRHSLREQFQSHETQIQLLEESLDEHRRESVPTKGLALQNYKEKEAYLCFEIKRYKAYVHAMRSRLTEYENQHEVVDLPISSNLAATGATVSTVSVGVYNEAFNEVSPNTRRTTSSTAKQHDTKLTTIFSDG